MERDSVFLEVGKTIGLIQMADSAFKHMIVLAFPKSGVHTISALTTADAKLRKATLGTLIKILQERMVLRNDFEKSLAKYLDDRNALVHNWTEIEGWKDNRAAIAFCLKLQRTAGYMLFLFSAVTRSWMEQVGIDLDRRFPELREFFSELDSQWKPHLHDAFDGNRLTSARADGAAIRKRPNKRRGSARR